MKDEVEKLIAVDVTLIIDEDVQLLVNGVPIFTITQEQRVYRAVVSNPKAKAKLLALALSCCIEKPDMKMWKDIKNRKKFHRYAQDKAVTAAIDTMERNIRAKFQ